ncbi:hypothetical protein ACU635_31280 [[Actinomadura] parvosata]|uniref:hypothetical protein n=1 Tax=[Actinomadura] parvosata TaxID=1955412 RepID=UPI00406C29D4
MRPWAATRGDTDDAGPQEIQAPPVVGADLPDQFLDLRGDSVVRAVSGPPALLGQLDVAGAAVTPIADPDRHAASFGPVDEPGDAGPLQTERPAHLRHAHRAVQQQFG